MENRKQADGAGHGKGAALAVARVAVDRSYPGIPPLLKTVIGNEDKAAWKQILARMDYMYPLARLPRGAFVGNSLPWPNHPVSKRLPHPCVHRGEISGTIR